MKYNSKMHKVKNVFISIIHLIKDYGFFIAVLALYRMFQQAETFTAFVNRLTYVYVLEYDRKEYRLRLESMFVFHDTKEGYEYWQRIAMKHHWKK